MRNRIRKEGQERLKKPGPDFLPASGLPNVAHASVKAWAQIRDKGAIGSRSCSLSTQSINSPAARDAAGISFFQRLGRRARAGDGRVNPQRRQGRSGSF
jgi:hypothetical protein